MGGVNQICVVTIEYNHVFLTETLFTFNIQSIMWTVYLNGNHQSVCLNLIFGKTINLIELTDVAHRIRVECCPHIRCGTISTEWANEFVVSVKEFATVCKFFYIKHFVLCC